MFRLNLESGLELQVRDRMEDLYPDPRAIAASRRQRRRAIGRVRRARRSVGRALVSIGTQIAGSSADSLPGGQQAA
jgi:hypothetical protein